MYNVFFKIKASKIIKSLQSIEEAKQKKKQISLENMIKRSIVLHYMQNKNKKTKTKTKTIETFDVFISAIDSHTDRIDM